MEVKMVGTVLVIEIQTETTREPSASGKTLGVASSHGNIKTTCIDPVTGKQITIGLNAYVTAKGDNKPVKSHKGK